MKEVDEYVKLGTVLSLIDAEEAIGDTCLRDVFEARMFAICNKDIPVTLSGFQQTDR